MFEDIKPNSEKWLSLNNFKNEIWKDVKGYEKHYKISNYGRVLSCGKNVWNRFAYIYRDNFILKKRNNLGYNVVVLYLNGKRNVVKVHRIVAEHFIANPENKPFVNHIDGNRENNRIDNLEWCTAKENVRHAWATGLAKAKKCKPVEMKDKETGDTIKCFNSVKEASEYLQCSKSNIQACCSGRQLTCKGYKFSYKQMKN